MKKSSTDPFSEFKNEAAEMVVESPLETRKLLDAELYDTEPLQLKELYESFENRLSVSARDAINNLISSASHEIQVEELALSTFDEAKYVLEEHGYEDFIALISSQTYSEFQDSWASELGSMDTESPARSVYGVEVLIHASVPDSVLIVMSRGPMNEYIPPVSVVVCTCGW